MDDLLTTTLPEGDFTCPRCGAVFPTERDLRLHEQQEHGEALPPAV